MIYEPSQMIHCICCRYIYNSRIVKWISLINVELTAGCVRGSDSDQFNRSFGLFVNIDDSNTLYVADKSNNRIQIFTITCRKIFFIVYIKC